MDKLIGSIVSELERLKLRDIVVYDSKEISIIADNFIVSTADSIMQIEGVRNSIIELMDKEGFFLKNNLEEWRDGWCLMDFGNIIIHIFLEEIRSFYNIEGLFEGAGFKTILKK
ncbi:MAG: ribosome silencing factor [Brevinematales bacterium]|nr:ribosome silencing factor [Brevinematales bacterium]